MRRRADAGTNRRRPGAFHGRSPARHALMTTFLTDDPAAAAAVLRQGGAVAFPTETVYGLGARAFAPDALRRIFEAKGRPSDNPLILHLATAEQLPLVAASVPPAARRLLDAFTPGPLTLVLPRHPDVPRIATAGLDTVGVRVPAHPLAHAFLSACGEPVAAPSANRSGRPSPTTWEAVQADLDGRIDAILRGAPASVGLESTVVDVTGDVPVVLRAGAVTLEALRAICPGATLVATADQHRRSPGTRHRHYAPTARVQLVDAAREAAPDPEAGYIGLDAPPHRAVFGLVAVCPDVASYAQQLFDFFRRCEAAGLHTVFCQRVASTGLGLALMDRLQRAAQA